MCVNNKTPADGINDSNEPVKSSKSTSNLLAKSSKEYMRLQFLNAIRKASYLSLLAVSSTPRQIYDRTTDSSLLTLYPQAADAAVKGYKTIVAQSLYSPGKVLYNNICPILPQSALLNSLNYIDNENIYDLISEMQNYLESFIQLINPTYSKQIKQISNENSILWNNLRLNAQRAAAMFIYNRDEIFLSSSMVSNNNNNNTINTNTTSSNSFRTDDSNSNSPIGFELRQKAQYRQRYLNNLKYDVLSLVKASMRSDSIECLRYMRNSLNSLLEVAYLYTPFCLSSSSIRIRTDPSYIAESIARSIAASSCVTLDDSSPTSSSTIPCVDADGLENNTEEFLVSNNKHFDSRSTQYEAQLGLASKLSRLPKLIGRARVTLYLQRPGSDSPILSSSKSLQQQNDQSTQQNKRSVRLVSDGSSKKNLISTVKLVVDGVSHPYTAGNFIDLCQKGFYDNTVISKSIYNSGGRNSSMGSSSSSERKKPPSSSRPLPIETKKFYKNYANNTNISSAIFPNDNNSNEKENDKDVDDDAEAAYERGQRKLYLLNNVNMTLFGVTNNINANAGGYIDSSTGRVRRVPLEILRQNISSTSNNGNAMNSRLIGKDSSKTSKGSTSTSTSSSNKKSSSSLNELEDYVVIDNNRYIAEGLLHNTAFFTKAEPVLSFATYGAIGMYHAPQDGDGASSSFFYVSPSPQSEDLNLFERHTSPAIDRLNNYYSLFAYVIEGIDVLEQLKEGDVLVSTIIEDNAWELEQLGSQE